MIGRRELLIGGLGIAAAAGAEALRPRQRLVLLKKGSIKDSLPMKFGAWSAEASAGLVSPILEGKLAKSLYREIVSLIYNNETTGTAVMLLAAYGDTQSDLLQLHRPEACYPAVGFALRLSEAANIAIAPKVLLPGRKVVAHAENRDENIIYWARLGEMLPQSAQEQRTARFENALHGYIPDGILVRCSALGEATAAFRTLEAFIPALLHAVAGPSRPALIGSKLAAEMPA